MLKFLDCSSLLSRLPHRPSRTKRANRKALKLLVAELAGADEDTNKAVNSFILKILQELSRIFSTSEEGQIDLWRGEHLDQNALHRLFLAMNHHPLDDVLQNLSISANRGLSSSLQQERWNSQPDSHQSSGSIAASEQQYSRQPLQHCTHSQLELLLQLEAVVHWNQCLATCGLGVHQSPSSPRAGTPPDISLDLCSPRRSGRLRVGSWNLKQFTLAKAQHPGFRETVCLTILRAQLSLIVLQEVASLDVANVLCAELNNPTLPHVKSWLSRHGSRVQPRCWGAATSFHSTGLMYQGQEYAIYLYNSAAGVDISRTSLLQTSTVATPGAATGKFFSRNPCSALCQIRSSRFVIASVHLKAAGKWGKGTQKTAAEVHNLGALIDAFNDTQSAGSHLIVLGDFNLHPEHTSFDVFRRKGMLNVLSGLQSTTVSSISKKTDRCCRTALDNAWLSAGLCTSRRDSQPSRECSYTSHSGVIVDGLRHPLIPNNTGAGANGFVSDHCPIWFDLYVP